MEKRDLIMSETKNNDSIYVRLGQVMQNIKAIGKNQTNVQQKFKFRGIDDFMNELHDHFADAGIIIIPSEKDHMQEQFTTNKGSTQFRTRLHINFTFVSTADGSSVTADGWGEAADSGDKGYNKCKSIALKYVLMQMFLVPTRDLADPDSETPEEVTGKVTIEDPDLVLALQLVKEANNITDLKQVWREHTAFQNNKQFYAAVQAKNRELSANDIA